MILTNVNKSILDTIEEKGKINLLLNLGMKSFELARGNHQSDEDHKNTTVLPTASKFLAVDIKGLVSW